MKITKSMIALMILIILVSSVHALGIGPVLVYKVYEPGRSDTVTLHIFNNENQSLVLDISARGALADDIGFESTRVYMDEGTHSAQLRYTVTYPDDLPAGAQMTDIVVTEIQGKGGSTVIAAQSLISKLRVQVPYQTIYAEAKMIARPKANRVDLEIQVYNYGIFAIYASADIDIFKDSQKVDILKTGEVFISSMQEGTLGAGTTLEPGTYRAVAYVHYEDRTIELEQTFVIGKKDIEITDLTVDDFTPGDVARIRMMLNNNWPEPIPGVHGEIFIVRDNRQIETITTETFTLVDTKELIAYWNTKDMDYGTYDAKANIIYGDEITTKDFTIEISEVPKKITDEGKSDIWLIVILIILLIFAIEIALCWRFEHKFLPCRKLKAKIILWWEKMKLFYYKNKERLMIWWKNIRDRK